MRVEIWTKPSCTYCTKAKELLKAKEIPYREMIISPGFGEQDLEAHQAYVTKEQLLEKAPSARTVPQIWLNDSYIGGFTELDAFFRQGSTGK